MPTNRNTTWNRTDAAADFASPELWSGSPGDANVTIAVLDGNIDLSHPCFAGAKLRSLSLDCGTMSCRGSASDHGTHVASIIFGQRTSPVVGIAPGCRGIIIPIFEQGAGSSLKACSQVELARGILLAAENGADIINISGGQFEPSGDGDPFLTKAVRECVRKGILIVAAAGNDGCDCLHVPASLPNVLAVGAMNRDGHPLALSNWGKRYLSSGILALGESITGAVPGGGIAKRSGTSFACAIVSGIAARLLSRCRPTNPSTSPLAIREAILRTAIGCLPRGDPKCAPFLAGRLNTRGAFQQLIKEGHIVETLENNLHAEPAAAYEPQPGTHNLIGIQPAETRAANMVAPSAAEPHSLADPTAIPNFPVVGNVGSAAAAGVAPSGCGCGGSDPAPVYPLGQLAIDFGTEARRDAILQDAGGKDIHNPHQLLEYLNANPAAAASVIWVLQIDSTPIYAIRPHGPFAATIYERLREFLKFQLAESAERVAVPGRIFGRVSLMNGQSLPVIVPEICGMYSWSTASLIDAVLGAAANSKEATAARQEKAEGIRNFLDRVYYEIRNLGVTSQDRAMNYAATNAFQLERVYKDAIRADMKLDSIDVEKSPICRPGSDCWDVKLMFFHPTKRLELARMVYRFTVDVSDVLPVTVGKVRSWHVF